ncbi:MAG: peptidylprolyl isomerase [Aureliella sp.]
MLSASPLPASAQDIDEAERQKMLAQMEKELIEKRIKPQSEEFQNATRELRDHVKGMREVIIRYNNTEPGEKSKELHREFLSKMAKGNELHQKMIAAAVAEFRAGNGDTEKLAGMLDRWTERDADKDRFEGVLEACNALIEANYPEPDVLRRAFLSAAAVNEYEEADRLVDLLDKKGARVDLVIQARQDLPMLKRRWERELKLREKDAAGEPLPIVELVTTKGIIEIELFENQAPNTVANFINLVEEGFYDNNMFHRVIEHFAAQAGSPDGDGAGNAGFTIASEATHPDNRDFFRGSVGMALANDIVDSASSQFFISFNPARELDEKYTAFGRVIKGIHVIGNLAKINPEASKEDKEKQEGLMPDEILSARVIRKRSNAYEAKRREWLSPP